MLHINVLRIKNRHNFAKCNLYHFRTVLFHFVANISGYLTGFQRFFISSFYAITTASVYTLRYPPPQRQESPSSTSAKTLPANDFRSIPHRDFTRPATAVATARMPVSSPRSARPQHIFLRKYRAQKEGRQRRIPRGYKSFSPFLHDRIGIFSKEKRNFANDSTDGFILCRWISFRFCTHRPASLRTFSGKNAKSFKPRRPESAFIC